MACGGTNQRQICFNRSGAIVWILTAGDGVGGDIPSAGFNRSGAIVWILTPIGR